MRKKELSFYIYKWNGEYTTFVVADSVAQALETIEEARQIACPPNLQNEELSKKQLTKAGPNFILTVSSPPEPKSDNKPEMN